MCTCKKSQKCTDIEILVFGFKSLINILPNHIHFCESGYFDGSPLETNVQCLI